MPIRDDAKTAESGQFAHRHTTIRAVSNVSSSQKGNRQEETAKKKKKEKNRQASKTNIQHTTTFSNTASSFRQTQALEHARGMGQKGSKPGPPMPEGQAALFASSSSKRKGGRSGMVMTENKHYVSDPTLFDQMQQQPSSATSNHNTTSSSSSSNDGTEPVAPPMSRKDLTVAREVGHGRAGEGWAEGGQGLDLHTPRTQMASPYRPRT